MALTGQNIASKVSLVLTDESNVRWTVAELLGWINSAQREIVLFKPNASLLTTNAATVAGTKQTIPTPGLLLIDVIRNMGTGSTPGNAITKIERNILDVAIPNWHASSGAGLVVKHYVFDPKDPKTYYVYPPLSDATQKIEICMCTAPTDLATINSTISIDDIYETVIVDYVLFRAFSKDANYAANAARAESHHQAFMAALGGKAGAETAFAPPADTTSKA